MYQKLIFNSIKKKHGQFANFMIVIIYARGFTLLRGEKNGM